MFTNKMHRFKMSKHFHVRLKNKKEKEKPTLMYKKFVESQRENLNSIQRKRLFLKGGSKGRGYMYTYGRFTLRSDRKQQIL